MPTKSVNEISLPTFPLDRLRPALSSRRYDSLSRRLETAGSALSGRLWHVNSTATGGGVAEMLVPLTAYARGLGLDARWAVISGDPRFFDLTKRLHNGIHGVDGVLVRGDRRSYESTSERNSKGLLDLVRRGDVVLCHDPQTAGLIPSLKEIGALVIWRSHIGHEDLNGSVGRTWRFLLPYIEQADAVVFSRDVYIPHELRELETHVIHPSIDPLSPKNMRLSRGQVRAILLAAGILGGKPGKSEPTFTRADGTPGRIERTAQVLRVGDPPPFGTPLVVQVSRWDRLKDPVGVMLGFARHVKPGDAHLMLAGPDVSGVADDPEGAEVFAEVQEAWRELPAKVRARVHIVSLPMVDVDENAAMVNALQRAAKIVVQKSIYEGFGLTVTEAMWKSRAVVASAVGGITEQIVSGVHGLLVEDPHDLRSFGAAVQKLLDDPVLAKRLGRNAKERAASKFLVSRHLLQWLEFISRVGNGNGDARDI
ncbi:MAG: glycosyltransferase [Planctomycetota bacterium]|jgi:trehalose synthase